MLVDERPVYYKNKLIQIFRDHWEQFKHFHPHLVNEDIEANVQKMIGCGLFSNGYAEYRCRCGYIKRVAFSCKSRFCLRCSKVYVDNWVAKMKQTIFAKIEHRHIILTVPGSLWRYFHTKDILKLLADCGAKLIEEVVSVCLKGK
ncbi:MAG: transposase zinc-binding domain-containing protein, partial [Candidatus Omnitrophota bacterium]